MAGNIFGKIASDALGLSDIGKILDPKDFNKADVDDYIFHEENEEIFFVIKSATDEYCFTNLAILHLDGQKAVSSKKILRRYDYFHYTVKDVKIETAGTIDLDCEVKFTLVGKGTQTDFSIDINKNQEEQIKDIYKALHKISSIQAEGILKKNDRDYTLNTVKETFGRSGCENIAEQFKDLMGFVNAWNEESFTICHTKDFGDIYRLYINN